MRVWRIAKAKHAQAVDQILSGEGARLNGGRWSPRGLAAVYCAETSSLAALEILVHLPKPADFNKLSYRIVDLEVPDGSIVSPAGSMDVPQAVGEAVLPSHLAFIVPSFANSLERNVVLNPEHPSFSRVTPGVLRPFFLDHRLGP